jgi:hypothetical protein
MFCLAYSTINRLTSHCRLLGDAIRAQTPQPKPVLWLIIGAETHHRLHDTHIVTRTTLWQLYHLNRPEDTICINLLQSAPVGRS